MHVRRQFESIVKFPIPQFANSPIPPSLKSPIPQIPNSPISDRVLRRFLASHAFANWTAHLGRGLRAWWRSVDAAHTLARRYGVRHADLVLRHLADPNELAAYWSTSEAS